MLTEKQEKERAKKLFKKLYGKKAPHYKVLKKEHPLLFNIIMKYWNGYRAFLRSINIKPPKPTPREKAFIEFSSRCAKRYYENGEWSTFEKEMKTLIDKICLDLGLTYIHNYKYPSMKGKGYYKFDFYFFLGSKELKARIECDGVFHRIGNTAERDKAIDDYLRSKGIETLRITIKDDPNKYAIKILAFLLKRIGDMSEMATRRSRSFKEALR